MYKVKIIQTVDHGKGHWKTLKVEVFRIEDAHEEQIGAYERDYHSLFRSFCWFRQHGKDYALYSPQYTTTRVMELPSCRDIGGEEPHTFGFCPVDYYVPAYLDIEESHNHHQEPITYRLHEPFDEDDIDPEHHSSISPLWFYQFGLIAGCIWGDDSSWKIQYLDLSNIENGKITRTEKFGYIELPEGLTLRDATRIWYDPDETNHLSITIAVQKRFELDRTGEETEQ